MHSQKRVRSSCRSTVRAYSFAKSASASRLRRPTDLAMGAACLLRTFLFEGRVQLHGSVLPCLLRQAHGVPLLFERAVRRTVDVEEEAVDFGKAGQGDPVFARGIGQRAADFIFFEQGLHLDAGNGPLLRIGHFASDGEIHGHRAVGVRELLRVVRIAACGDREAQQGEEQAGEIVSHGIWGRSFIG